jgi:hypothetical protein
MLFELTVHTPGAPDRQFSVTDNSLIDAVGTALAKVRELLHPSVLRGALGHAEPFLPAIAEAAGAGLAGQVGVQVAAALARRALDDAQHRTHAAIQHSDHDGGSPTATVTSLRPPDRGDHADNEELPQAA